ncbi:ABCB family ABC transporter ATP-binding protein/permease [Rhodovibrionaceae bacterium A322]
MVKGVKPAHNPTDGPARSQNPPERTHWATLVDLSRYIWPAGELELRARVVLAMILLISAKVANALVPLLYKEAVDALTGDEIAQAEATKDQGGSVTATVVDSLASLPNEIVVPIGVIVAYGLARVLALSFQELRDAVFVKVGQRAVRKVGIEVFRHLHALSLQFHLERQTGGLTRVIERGTKGIEGLLNFALFSILPTFVELALSTGILWYLYGFEVALITFATVVTYVVYTYKVTEWRLTLRRRMNDSDQKANTRAIDSLLNFETVKYFTNERHEEERYDEGLKSYEKAATASKVSLSILNIGQALIIAIGVTSLMLLAATRVAAGEMTTGDFVAVNAYMMQMAQPLNFFGFVYREIKQSLVDMEAMFRLLLVSSGVVDAPDARPMKVEGAEIAFKNVHFHYHEDRPILRGISFSVPAGQTVAVVGSSGAGKSTLSRLLFRFYDVAEGTIEIDGQDIREVTQLSLREAIGIVPQDTVLFNDTIAYNIAYGRPSASEEDLIEARNLARLDTLMTQLPDGMETVVGERGLKMSGGEKQRVAIARAVLKKPAILLFDEATSALDTKTEKEILNSLKEVSKGRTTLVIAHRLSTIIDADNIIVLEAGRVVEQGRHQELLAADGLYAEMWRRQQESKDEGEEGEEEEDSSAS